MSQLQKKSILLAAGGTGGHFFPAIALAEEFSTHQEIDVNIVTDNRCKKYLNNEIKVNSHIVDLYINTNGVFGKFKVPFVILISLIKAFILIRKIKPTIIIGFGGYPTFPIMYIGQLLSIPIIIYEQNSFLGKTNQFFFPKAKIIALAYENTNNLAKKFSDKIIIIGDLVRNNIKNLAVKKNFKSKPFTLLVIGGSQGARFFSNLVPNAIKILVTKYPDIKLNVIQQVPKDEQKDTKKIYDELKIHNIISDFFHDIYKYYESSNLLIARSGATTIAELTQIGLPAVFIPFPYASDDHQYYNAKALADIGASWFYRQEEISAEILADKLYELINDPTILETASINLLKRKKNGTKNLADTVLKIIA